jgi:hypothetical protein
MSVSKTPLASVGRLEHYIAYGALGAAALALVVLLAVFAWRRRSPRKPVAVPEYAIVHTPLSRLRNMAWAVATSVACLLATRVLGTDDQAGGIVQLIRAVLDALIWPGAH